MHLSVHTSVVKPHALRAPLQQQAFGECQFFQHRIYRTERVLVKSGNFTVELAKVLEMLREVSSEQGPGLQQDSITQWRTLGQLHQPGSTEPGESTRGVSIFGLHFSRPLGPAVENHLS